jgi:hypothetical protein
MPKYTITYLKTGQRQTALELETVSKITLVDPDEIVWAIQEYGEGTTDEHVVTEDEEFDPDLALEDRLERNRCMKQDADTDFNWEGN